MCDDDGEEEALLSAWAFARLHGLARPFDLDDPRRYTKGFDFVQAAENDDVEELVVPGLASATVSVEAMSSEKLDVVAGVAGLLFEIMTDCQSACHFDDLDPDPAISRPGETSWTRSKLVLPLLHTDEELDLLRVQRLSAVSVTRHGAKRLRVNVEADEGFEWSQSALQLPRQKMQSLAVERLDVSRDALQIMRSFMVDDWCESDERATSQEIMRSIKRRKLTPITPPLSPLVSMPTCVNSSPIEIDLDPWSGIADPDVELLQDIENNLLELDVLCLSSSQKAHAEDADQLVSRFINTDMLSTSSPPDLNPIVLGKLKVELPLFTNTDEWEVNAINIAASVFDTAKDSQDLLWHGQTDEALQDAMKGMLPYAHNADMMLQQEQLLSKDSKLRIEVQPIASSKITAPWDMCSQSFAQDQSFSTDEMTAQRRYIINLREGGLWDLKSWSGASVLERSMPWKPFSDRAAKHVLVEAIDQSEFLTSILECMTMTDVVTSDAEAWKPEGLRILDNIDGDEDLENANLDQASNGLEGLLRQKHLEMRLMDKLQVNDSTSGQLQRFFSSNGIALTPSAHPRPSRTSATMDPRLAGRQQKHQLTNAVSTQVTTSPMTAIVLPPVAAILPARSFIISAEVTRTRRKLYSRLQLLYPDANLIERDFDNIENNRGGCSKISSTSVINAALPLAEADILLSPSTGLLMTTLQKIQQISLPGTLPQTNAFSEQVIHLARRYERLVILVCQTLVNTSSVRDAHAINSGELSKPRAAYPLTISDIKALTELNALAGSLSSDITVQLVLGGERELAGWAVFHMSKVTHPYDVAQDESFWERILRRAGMNAFAACAVLDRLGRPQATAGSDNLRKCSDGLTAFMQMHPEQRVAEFADVFGGENVLRKVNTCLERRWISAGRGYDDA